MSLLEDLIAVMQNYADTGGNLDFISAWGAQGNRIQIRGEGVDTGQGWDLSPSFLLGVFSAAASVLGDWTADDVDVVAQSTVTLSAEPALGAALYVFYEGVLLRHVDTPTLANHYRWVGGTTVEFSGPLTGWIAARYLAKQG